MATKKKTLPKPKTAHHAEAKKVHTKAPTEKAPKTEEISAETTEKSGMIETSMPQSHEYTPRLDRKDELNPEAVADELEKKKEEKKDEEEKVELKTPPTPREVPHIDIPVVDKEESAQPAWHTVNEDLPAIARPTNVPAPIPPSQTLTSDQPPAGVQNAPEAHQTKPAPVTSKPDVHVMPISEEYMPIPAKKVTIKSTGPAVLQADKPAEKPPAPLPPVSITSKKPFKLGSILFFIIGIAVGVAVLLAVVWGYVALTTRFSLKIGNFTLGSGKVSQKAEVSPTPTPVPVLTFDPATVSFQVLNGSGVRGAAADASQKLQDKGYVVVETGNAPQTVDTTEVYLTADADTNREKILSDITGLFPEATLAGTLTDPNTTASARLVIGKD